MHATSAGHVPRGSSMLQGRPKASVECSRYNLEEATSVIKALLHPPGAVAS